MELRELFIKYLTEDIDNKTASAIFNKKTGKQTYGEVRVDMVMWAFDKAVNELNK